jgi:hypothetical protein
VTAGLSQIFVSALCVHEYSPRSQVNSHISTWNGIFATILAGATVTILCWWESHQGWGVSSKKAGNWGVWLVSAAYSPMLGLEIRSCWSQSISWGWYSSFGRFPISGRINSRALAALQNIDQSHRLLDLYRDLPQPTRTPELLESIESTEDVVAIAKLSDSEESGVTCTSSRRRSRSRF